ncbi:hypothetical protein NEIG_02432 [Nematocida sp. ERTm5]|nr:hypothetical protein NEIG_02432 [Nematocida sp. ERTm5]
MNPANSEIDPFEENKISEEQLTNMFLSVTESSGIYKKYDFGDIIMCKNAEEYINKQLTMINQKKYPKL